jgi:hypothetical protein
MKIKKTMAAAGLCLALFSAGCSDSFLDRPPISQISADNFYQTTNDLRLATAALYGGKPWGEWNFNCFLPIGDVLSGNLAVNYWGDAVQLNTFAVTGSNEIMIANWKGMYKVIAHCNVTIKAIEEKAPASIPEKDKLGAIAEARFLRAFAYYNLALLWRDVPIIKDNTELISTPLVHRNPLEDVFRFAANDLLFAAKNLPAKDAAGRLTTWSAQGMLSKVYLTWAGVDAKGNGPRNQALLDSAKLHAGNVCKQSGLSLLPNYADLFKTQFNDNQESLFALQWAPGTGWLEGNMLQVYSPGGPEISAAGQAGWFGIAPTYDLYKQYAKEDTIRRKATVMLKGDYYPELNAAGGGYKFAGNAGLKKHIIGTRVDNSAPTMTLTSSIEHNALLRLAEVYLIYAEAIMGNSTSTSNADALLYFNKVRTRAGLAAVTSLDAETLFKERRVELAAEGHFWEDLVRLSYYNEPKAIKKLNEQERVLFTIDNSVVTKSNPLAEITPANTTTFKLPIPSPEVTANPKLLEAPVPYSF